MPGTTEVADDVKALSMQYIEAVGSGRLDRVAKLLHPDVAFVGPTKPLHGARAYLDALRRLGPILLRNDVKKVVAEGNHVAVFYDFITDTEVGPVPSAEWLSFEDGSIREVHLVFHTQPWPKVIDELGKRSVQSHQGRP